MLLLSALNKVLAPVVPMDQARNQQQQTHLRAVVLECARFGYMLLSQPNEWHLDYGEAELLASANAGDAGLVVITCPGLQKLGGRDGVRYPVPLQVVVPVLCRI